jgi:thiamine pyrophosphate-dependent acetolactate synthase large subunit-like protein
MAHGYFKIEGKPLLVLAHGTVGLQHASMAIYNAWCDRMPMFIILGNTLVFAPLVAQIEAACTVEVDLLSG